jgi:LmbE family N-acetylglucosaminyl deacetylase
MDCLMAFAAHPDDEGAMLGTLAKYSKLAQKVIIVWATRGERWVWPFNRFKPFWYWLFASKNDISIKNKLYNIIAKIRSKEINNVLKLLKIKGEFLGFIDGNIPPPSNKEGLKEVIEVIRKYQPRIVITHHFREGHSDHKNLSNLVFQAFLLSGSPKIKTGSPPFKPEILAWWDERGIGFKPNFFLNVNDSIKIFNKWKKIHKSQLFRIVGQIPIIKARIRAINTPLKLTECFQIVRPEIIGKLYGEIFPHFSNL